MINLIVSPLIKKIDDFIDRVTFSEENKKDLPTLRNSLEQLMLCSVISFQEGEHEGVNGFKDVADCVYEVEDLIDKQIWEFGKTRNATKARFTCPGKSSCNITGSFIGNLANHPQFLKSVPEFKTKLDKFHNKETLLQQEKGVEPAKPHLELKPISVNPKLPDGGHDQLFVGVVGISGLWRTAMVHAMIESLSRDFRKPFFAWVHFFEYHDIHNLLTAVIKAFDISSTPVGKELDMMGTEELGLYLYESLIKGPYLLMLENVSDLELWDQLRKTLPDNKKGSRVIITTHIRSLIEKSGGEGTQVYEFPVEKMTNASLPEICSLFDSSFDHLPHLLKLCYLYLGLFPEKSEINIDKLIRLWVAEGFIKSAKGSTPEEVAMDYVNELADRSLIEIMKRNATRIATCRVQPCLRYLFAKKSGKLFHTTDGENDTDPIRRLASHCGFTKKFRIDKFPRTIMVFSKDNDPVTKISKLDPFDRLTLLQVLDLEGTWFPASRENGKTSVPKVIEKLILLRYLGLNDTYIDDIPPFIKNLQDLQTLYVDMDIPVSIPNEITELKKLRHLYGLISTQQSRSYSFPSELQTLGHIMISSTKFNFKNFKMLKELYLVFTQKRIHDIGAMMAEVKTLQTLFIKIDEGYEGSVDLKSFSKFPNLLQLKLKGENKITELPSNMGEIFPKLKYLSIPDPNDFPLQKLAKLPKLTILDLYRLSRKVLSEEAVPFPQLEILQLIEYTGDHLSFIETKITKLKELWIEPKDNNIPQKLKPLLKPILTPKDWGRCNDDDWPYFPRTITDL